VGVDIVVVRFAGDPLDHGAEQYVSFIEIEPPFSGARVDPVPRAVQEREHVVVPTHGEIVIRGAGAVADDGLGVGEGWDPAAVGHEVVELDRLPKRPHGDREVPIDRIVEAQAALLLELEECDAGERFRHAADAVARPRRGRQGSLDVAHPETARVDRLPTLDGGHRHRRQVGLPHTGQHELLQCGKPLIAHTRRPR
jgi:hypothetical protein